jgi:hypothetical protein
MLVLCLAVLDAHSCEESDQPERVRLNLERLRWKQILSRELDLVELACRTNSLGLLPSPLL